MDKRYINGVGLGIGYVNWLLRRSCVFHEAKLIYLFLQGQPRRSDFLFCCCNRCFKWDLLQRNYELGRDLLDK